jgi:hypothetical protein
MRSIRLDANALREASDGVRDLFQEHVRGRQELVQARPVAHLGRDAVHLGLERIHRRQQHRFQQQFLAAVVVLHVRQGHAGLGRHAAHRQAGIAIRCQQRARGLQDRMHAFPAFFGREGGLVAQGLVERFVHGRDYRMACFQNQYG